MNFKKYAGKIQSCTSLTRMSPYTAVHICIVQLYSSLHQPGLCQQTLSLDGLEKEVEGKLPPFDKVSMLIPYNS